MANELIGGAELSKALKELRNVSSSEWRKTLRDSVKAPMDKVKQRAQVNLARISPGKALSHKTYLGRLVSSGFAARSLLTIVSIKVKQGVARAVVGVKKEAFYVLSFFELGTSTIPRQPWLLPAFQSLEGQGFKMVVDAMKERIEAIAKRNAQKSARAARRAK